MLYEDVKKAVERFTIEELRQLREYIAVRERSIMLKPGTVDMPTLLDALTDIRQGLNEEDFTEIERAMNEEYIEPLDKNL